VTRRLFATLCGLVFLVNYGRVAFAPLLDAIQRDFAVGAAEVGIVASLVWIGSALPRIPVGYLLTKVSRHWIVLATGALLTVAAAFTAVAPSLVVLRVGALAIGLASGAYFTAAIPLVGELYPDAIGRAVGIHGTASQLAAVVAPSIAVAVLLHWSWRSTFWLLAGGAAAATVVLLAVVRSEGVPDSVAADRDFAEALAHWRLILVGMAVVGTVGFAWQGLFNFYISYLTGPKALPRGVAGNLLTVAFAAGVPAFFLSGRLADRLPQIPYLLGIVAAFTGSLAALTAASSVAGLVAVSAVLGYVVHSAFPAVDTFLLDSFPDGSRASAYAVYSGLTLFVQAGGSGTVGLLVDAGFAFDDVFRGFAAGLVVVLVVLGAFAVTGRLPGATPRPPDTAE
jgi:predicted MFS family arabinose efflux permease